MRALPVILLRLALLVAIAASAVLVIEYANAGDPAFCGVQSGCFAVRISPYSKLFGVVPLPTVGLAAFPTLLVLSLLASRRVHHIAVAVLAGLGGLFAVWLLYLQKFVIQAFCPWCVAVDISAMVVAGSAVLVALTARDGERPKGIVPGAWYTAALLAVIVPYIWSRFPAVPPLPPELAAVQVPSKLTIVTFSDFECPFCRLLHPKLHELSVRYAGRVQLVRRMYPLRGHPGAEPAALVYLCTPEPLREAVADKLYSAEPELLVDQGSINLGVSAGLDREALEACVKAPETRAMLDADKRLFEALGGRGIPYSFVGRRVVPGADAGKLMDSVTQELEGDRLVLPVWLMFVLLGVVFLGAVVVTVRKEGQGSASPEALARARLPHADRDNGG